MDTGVPYTKGRRSVQSALRGRGRWGLHERHLGTLRASCVLVERTHVLVDRAAPAMLLRGTCPLGLGGPLAGHPVRRAPGLAQGQ